jgi:ABC-type uncharacterized transport system permease subunit
MVIVLYALTAFLYAGLAWHAWATRNPQERVLAVAESSLTEISLHRDRTAWRRAALLLVLLTHGLLLHETIFRDDGMVFGFAYALSAMLWLGVGIYWIESFFFALAGLGLIVTPFALLASLLPLLFPGSQVLGDAAGTLFKFHFIIANVAYGLFTLAAFHAVLMLLAERRLHTFSRPGMGALTAREPMWLGRWLDLLPPLMTLEKLLFRLIGAGFVLLTLTIVSGVLFSETMFSRAARFDHKTVFALISWIMFGGILLARRMYGWRGRVALRWVIAAFCMLLLAYVGSRFVLEVVVHRL